MTPVVGVQVRRVSHVVVSHLSTPRIGASHRVVPRIVVGRHRVRWTPRHPSESLFPSQSVFPIGV